MELPENCIEFLKHCNKAREYAFSMEKPLVVHHYDADGISSGALVCASFEKEGKKYERLCIKKLDDATIEGIKEKREIIFVDLGSGNDRVNELEKVLIIDHHQPAEEMIYKQKEQIFHVNPLLFEIDGGNELSAASTAYCVFKERVDLAITGAVGDMQYPLKGMNRWVLEEGVKTGKIKIENDLAFYGRYSRPLVQFLAYADEPYIPNISYREDRAVQLMNSLGIELKSGEKWRTYSDLSDEEKKKLISAIAEVLAKYGKSAKAERLIGESYIFPNRPRNETYEANEFSTLLNACGRHGAADVGIEVCLDDRGYKKAKELLELHKRKIREGIEFANANIQDLGVYYFLDGRDIIDEGIIGIICGVILQGKITKPIIGVAIGENDTIKISGRGTRQLIAKNLNLGKVMKNACTEVGGMGGGHKIAAGASIPKNKLNEFLISAANVIKNQTGEN